MGYYCKTCGRTMDAESFYTSNNRVKYPNDGKLNECKKCITMFVDNWDPETFKPILEEIDVPYIKSVWDDVLTRAMERGPETVTGLSVLGRYVSKMRIKPWAGARWADTEELNRLEKEKAINAMAATGMSDEEIEAELARPHVPEKPAELPFPVQAPKAGKKGQTPANSPFELPPDTLMDELEEEDRRYLELKWGLNYRADEWVRMEQLYNDMMASYDIQGAAHKDTLIMLCKTSLKANQCIDCGDIDGFQKMQRAYDSLLKSGKFSAAQNKEAELEAIDSVGQLVAMCERDGFIPRYYTDSPQDKVDRVIQDMQQYTHDLITEELGLGSMIENALRSIQEEREKIDQTDNIEEQEENDLFDYTGELLSEEDFVEFARYKETEAAKDDDLE